MSCCNNRTCCNRTCSNVVNSGCFLSSSSVVRPPATPDAFYATLTNETAIASGAEIALTAVPVIGNSFSFIAPSNVSINRTGLYQINYSTTASTSEEGLVAVGLRVNGVDVSSTTQTGQVEEGGETSLSGNYMLNVTTVPTTVAMYNASANTTRYINPQLGIVRIG